MFKLIEEREFDWPVEVRLPQDGGRHVATKFTLRFRQVPVRRFSAIRAELEALQDDPALDEAEREALALDRLLELVVGWGRDVGDVDGEPLDFNRANFQRLLDLPQVLPAVVLAYTRAVSGQGREERRRGN